MTAPIENPTSNGRPDLKELTVMILFAGDNDLAALLVSQVKAIKDAGFHKSVDVVLHIDPSERGVPTRLLHVNRKRRERKVGGETVLGTSIGPTSSFVRNMGEDALSPQDLEAKGPFAKEMADSLRRPDKVEASVALKRFLGYCRENHSAKNYILILFGHGLVVGKDTFLIDEKPRSGITLPDLGTLLGEFSGEVENKDGAKLHLVGMHSCAMSAIEVAYQLKGAARYMIGAEGIAYVGSWPYLNLLVKIFRALDNAKEKPLPPSFFSELVDRLYDHTLYNGTDFVYMGYSLDLTLCSLDPKRYETLTGEIKGLVKALTDALGTERGKEMILLAHWKAQSYWDENYTDLYDFCFCLERYCKSLLGTLGQYAALLGKEAGSAEVNQALEQLPGAAALSGLVTACGKVREQLRPTGEVEYRDGDGPIVYSDNIGSQYQYSHGLSVYFPWSEPLDDEPLPPPPLALQSQILKPEERTAAGAINMYREYAFSKEFGGESWLSFLEAYFKATRRETRWKEEEPDKEEKQLEQLEKDVLAALPPGLAESHAVGSLEKATGGTEKPTGGSGSTCSCPSIKNYPIDEQRLHGRKVKKFFVTGGLFKKYDTAETGAGEE
jgi:Clostripain family